MEAAAIARCFGAEASRVAVSSSKGQIGHTLAAAGAIEAAISVMAIERGMLPPTIGLEEIDPACPLAHVLSARPARVRAVISNSFGFGGTDSVLVFTALDAFPDPPQVRSPSRIVVTGGATVGPLGVLGARGSLAYLDAGPAPAPGAIAVRPADHLDVGKARRLDRAARLTTIATATAGAEAGLVFGTPSCADVGAISGSAFGSVDGSTAFMRRVYDKGAKFASPADFPNLVPSSPIGHTSIYLGLRGPVLAVSDLEATAECAMVTAIELLSGGVGGAIFAGSAEEWSVMVDRCLGPLCSGITDRGPRSEGASALLFESGDRADARGAVALARVAWWTSWRGDGADALVDAPLPLAGSSIVVVGRASDRARLPLIGSPWSAVPLRAVADRAGDHEGAGGFAAVAAVAAIAARDTTTALVLGVARDRGFAILLVPDHP
jgi:3-oxoacyl-[acyl-carrier-protein] synthase II